MSGKMMPVAPLSRMSEVSRSWQLRTRTSGATPQPSAACAIWPTVSSVNSACCRSMKMKSCPVVLAPRETSPDRMRSMTGFFNSTIEAIDLSVVVPAKAGTHTPCIDDRVQWLWVPAFAGTTLRVWLASSSIPIRRVARRLLLGIEPAQHRRPFEHTIGAPRARLVEMRSMRQHVLARHGELGARRHGVDLRAAGELELVHGVEGLLDGGAAGEEPVVAHDQRIMRPEILHDALALVEIDRRAFVVVIADVADEP